MPKTARKTDPKARKAEMEALHNTLAAQVETLRSSDQWVNYLKFCQAFHRYSFNNLLLILAQNPGAAKVAGYRTWQSLGRQVRKGEKSIRILGGRNFTSTETDERTGEETTANRTAFFPCSVFDLAQTEPIDGAEDATITLAHRLEGTDDHSIYHAITEHLTATGWTVSREDLGGRVNGYASPDGQRVVIEAELSPAQAAKTALHEAAHIALGHTSQDYSEYVAHRGRCEVEAESVAYVLAGIFGLDTSAYSVGYLAHWIGQASTDLIQETAAHVLTTAHTLATALDNQNDAQAAA